MRLLALSLAAVALIGCGTEDRPSDAGSPDSGADTGLRPEDAGEEDTGAPDLGSEDGGHDAGVDAGADAGTPDQGSPDGGADAGGLFPPGAWFRQPIDEAPVRANSEATTRWLADNGGWGFGRMQIDFSLVVLEAEAETPTLEFMPRSGAFYPAHCDQVPFPLPMGGRLEGETGYACERDGDCHLLVVDRRVDRLFEMWRADVRGDAFQGGCVAAWDLTRVYGPEGRGLQCTSADAAGFPITPLLFTADEVAAGEIPHAIRFILPNDRMRANAFVTPATHAGGPRGPNAAPVYGSRWRLRADYPVENLSPGAQVVARAMQRYGMALADGGNIALTARNDWNTEAKWEGLLGPHDLRPLQPTDFEVIDTGPVIPLTRECGRTAY